MKTEMAQIRGFDYDGKECRLESEDGMGVSTGAPVQDRDGNQYVVTGGRPPHKPESTGRVWVREAGRDSSGEYFPSVFGMRWVRYEDLGYTPDRLS